MLLHPLAALVQLLVLEAYHKQEARWRHRASLLALHRQSIEDSSRCQMQTQSYVMTLHFCSCKGNDTLSFRHRTDAICFFTSLASDSNCILRLLSRYDHNKSNAHVKCCEHITV